MGFPTETVYGLGGNALDPGAAKAIYAAKGRPSDNPLIVHISAFEQIEGLASEIPEVAKQLSDAFWPGPLTMVLPKRSCVPDETTGGLATVAIRFPMGVAADIITYAGCPIAAPSANISGRPSPTSWQHVQKDLGGKIEAIVMGIPCEGGIESTVLDLTGDVLTILRPGLITPEMISAVTGREVIYDPAILGRPDPGLIPKAPGMKYKHYAPKAEMVLFSGEKTKVEEILEERRKALETAGKKVGVLEYADGREAAEKLFYDLRAMDAEGVDVILAAALPQEDSLGFSVMNRMLKSAGYNIEEV